jgi:hypothetical protein
MCICLHTARMVRTVIISFAKISSNFAIMFFALNYSSTCLRIVCDMMCMALVLAVVLNNLHNPRVSFYGRKINREKTKWIFKTIVKLLVYLSLHFMM